MEGNKEEDDLKLLTSLKQSKKNGILDLDEYMEFQEDKWRNTLDYDDLKYWLTCDNEELRLQTLELLIVSKKSTLNFTGKELNLIIVFLECNLREKIEYVPLIKKVLKRINDSYAVLRRQLEKENKLKELQKLHPEAPIEFEDLSNVQENVQYYHAFINSIHEICLNNLYPGAVNVRMKSSLQILCLMDEFLSEDLKNSLWNLDQFKELFDCLLLDTYEVNKDMIFRLIKSCKLIESFFDTKEKVLELINVAVQIGNSIRPLDSITAAYMLKIGMLLPNIQEVLLELIKFKGTDCIQEKETFYMIMLLKTCLEKPVKLASENIVIAASKHSLYGYIFCIHSVLSTINLRAIVNDECWRDMLADLVNMCLQLNIAVSQIVNNSSPEGHLPMDLNPRHLDCILQDMEEVVITPQMVLLCSWRTVKEISLLFGYLTSNASIFNEKTKTGLLSENQIKEIGNQLVTLLCETKHRGAFEQAHVGFGQLCNRLWHLDEDQAFLKQLPKMWLHQLLLAVIGLTLENSKLCATRRSAGVPFMVQALVTSEIKKRCDPKMLTFHSVMRILLKLTNIEDDFNLNDAKDILFNETLFTNYGQSQYINNMDKINGECAKLNENTEIKTHSLNILRALFRHCLLGELVKDYIAEGFIAAFRSYDGKSWAERNAATLLFSSLVVRVFGVQRTKDHVNLTLQNKMTGKNFFERFPSLLPFLCNELTIFINEPEDQIKPKIQSILLILSRLYPGISSEVADEDWKIDQFIDLVSKCGKSRVYKTRELAARALVPLVTEQNVLPISCNLLYSMMTSELFHNLLHGYTLQLLELVRSPQFAKVELPKEQLQAFFNFLNTKVLHNLESSNSSPACFPIATEVLEIFVELSNNNSYGWIYKDSIFLALLEKIQSHLSNSKILKRRPGIELYEKTALNLVITALGNSNYTGFLINNEYNAAQFWECVLHHKNTEVLTDSWTKLIYIIQKTKSPMLYDLGLMIVIKSLDQPVDDPDLQDAIFYFIYSAIKEMEEDVEYIQYTFSKVEEKNYMCMHIFNKLSQQLKMKTFYARGEFFKLFGKVFGFLLKKSKTTELSEESKKIIYDAFLSQSGMESNIDCRIGVSEILFDLYIDMTKKNDIYFILDWWTTLLQLLYDDNSQVRSNAARIVCKLLPESKLQCETLVTSSFFVKFVSTVGENVEALMAAFFCWSMTSAAVVLEEMDETDVFNKCCNYECFEPLQITKYCIRHLQNVLSKNNTISTKLSKPIKEWLQKQLSIDDTYEFDSLSELIIKYKAAIPDTEAPLSRILDPTYPAKLVKEIAYIEMKRIAIGENGLTSSN